MFFHIRHALHYAYERPVFLEPTSLRLTPRSDPAQQLLHHQLQIQPQPSGSSRVLEPDGGEAVVLWFPAQQQQLSIEVEMVLRTTRDNPFDWIVTHPPAAQLPASYPPSEARSLLPCLQGSGPVDDSVQQWASELAAEVDGSTTAS
jgi:transglutaminase-like putative cysteine protease